MILSLCFHINNIAYLYYF